MIKKMILLVLVVFLGLTGVVVTATSSGFHRKTAAVVEKFLENEFHVKAFVWIVILPDGNQILDYMVWVKTRHFYGPGSDLLIKKIKELKFDKQPSHSSKACGDMPDPPLIYHRLIPVGLTVGLVSKETKWPSDKLIVSIPCKWDDRDLPIEMWKYGAYTADCRKCVEKTDDERIRCFVGAFEEADLFLEREKAKLEKK